MTRTEDRLAKTPKADQVRKERMDLPRDRVNLAGWRLVAQTAQRA